MAKSIIPLSDLPIIDKKSEIGSDTGVYKNGAALLMDKPIEWSSFDVVKFVRSRIPVKKVGHAGTLDPLATGLLILCTGKATRTVSQIQDLPKTYVGKIKFGESTPSYDAETEADHHADWKHITRESIQQKIENNFRGTISQLPPAYSAVKVRGERLYKKARRGEDVELYPRLITIHNIEITDFSLPEITVRVNCGKGTYIRSLAHDMGIALDSRAHLVSLRRTDTGHFSVLDAFTPEQFDKTVKRSSNG